MRQNILVRLKNRYGEDIIKDFNLVRTDINHTLSSISNKYNFSREYARQLYKNIYGLPYTIELKQKTIIRKEKKLKDFLDPEKRVNRIYKYMHGRHSFAEYRIYKSLKEHGFRIDIPKINNAYDFLVNGLKIAIVSCFKSRKVHSANGVYYQFYFNIHNKINADIIIAFAAHRNEIYIIPNSELNTNAKNLYIRDRSIPWKHHPNCKNRYLSCLNNWARINYDLL